MRSIRQPVATAANLLGPLLATVLLLPRVTSVRGEPCARYKMLGPNRQQQCGCERSSTVIDPDIGSPAFAADQPEWPLLNDIQADDAKSGVVLPKELIYNLWPGGLVFYDIDKSYSKSNVELIKKAMSTIEEMVGKNHVEFREARSQDGQLCRRNYIEVLPGRPRMCEAHVGMALDEPTRLKLDPNYCMHLFVLIHEFIHAMGMSHEQRRPNRDVYLIVDLNNVLTSLCSNFYRDDHEDFPDTPFDIESIMMYSSCLSSCNGKPIMLNRKTGQLFGTNYQMSAGDVQKLRIRYPAENKVPYSNRLCRGANETSIEEPEEPEEPLEPIRMFRPANKTKAKGTDTDGGGGRISPVFALVAMVATLVVFHSLVVDASVWIS